MKKMLALLDMLRLITIFITLPVLIVALATHQTDRPEPEPQVEVSPTVSRVNSILWDFDRYNRVLYTDADIEIIEAAADRVMMIFRYAWVSDWLWALQIEHEDGEWGIENLLILIGSRVAAARNTGDDGYEAELLQARSRNLVQEQILQLIHESIEYFENK